MTQDQVEKSMELFVRAQKVMSDIRDFLKESPIKDDTARNAMRQAQTSASECRLLIQDAYLPFMKRQTEQLDSLPDYSG